MNTYKWPPPKIETIPANPDAETPITDALVLAMQAGWLSLGSSAPGAVKPLIEMLEVFERENADLKQRILPQYLGRAERAEKERQMIAHERDGMLEKLIVQQTTIANLHDVIDGMRDAPSATAATDVEPCCMEWDTCMKRCVPLAENWRMECKRLERLQAPRVEERVPGDHGYDRSASLAEGRYVCTCGACSHYTTKEQPK